MYEPLPEYRIHVTALFGTFADPGTFVWGGGGGGGVGCFVSWGTVLECISKAQ